MRPTRPTSMMVLVVVVMVLLSSSPTFVTSQDQTQPAAIPGWVGMILNAANQLKGFSALNKTTMGDNLQAVSGILTQLPGLLKGLSPLTMDSEDTDVYKILANLFSNPGAASLQWIEDMKTGGPRGTGGNTSAADTPQVMDTLVKAITSNGNNGQLQKMMNDVMKGLMSLNITADSTPQGILSALMTQPGAAGLRQMMQKAFAAVTNGSSDTQQMMQNMMQSVVTLASNDQMQKLVPSIVKGLMALNLDSNSSPQDILSAVMAQPHLVSDLQAAGQQILQQMGGSQALQQMMGGSQTGGLQQLLGLVGGADGVMQMLQKQFPVIPGSQCAADLIAFANGLQQSQMWALQMLDAMGKPVSGLLTGQLLFVGDFQECMDVSFTNGSSTIEGGFCNMAIAPPSAMASFLQVLGPTATLKIHLCMPKSCSENDLYYLFDSALKAVGSRHMGIQCHRPKDPTDDRRFIGVVITLSVLAALCLVATLYGASLDCKKTGKQPEKPVAYVNHGYTNDEKVSIPNGSHGNGELTNGKAGQGMTDTKLAEEGVANGQNGVGGINGLPPNGSANGINGSAAKPAPSTAAPCKASEEGLAAKLLLSFSVLRNGRKVLSTAGNQSDIACLHGIRVLSITWVVLGHSFSMFMSSAAFGNKTAFITMLGEVTYMAILAGVLAVDTFFLLSGCLTAFLFLRTTQKNGITGSGIVLYYIHRYWRLTPLYALLIAVYVGIFPYLKTGPFENDMAMGLDSVYSCRDYWYFNILYVNNVLKDKMSKICFGWSWYLSNDMQFSYLAPIVLIPWALKGRVKIVGFVLCLAMVLTHCISTGVIVYDKDAAMFNGNNGDYMKDVYFVPWCRIGPYAVGLLLGYVLHVTKGKYTMDKLGVFLGWTMATAVGLTLVYVNYDNVGDLSNGIKWNASQTAAYESLSRVAWALCVSWVIFTCSTGYGGFVNTLMSWSAWAPLSRLTYGVYLIHLIVLFVLGGNLQKPLYMDAWTGTQLTLATTVLSFLLAFCFSMLIEAPTLGLEKVVLGKIFRKRS